jgi:ATP-dependent exoDNAse (exonuclease V) alpha subunit
MDNGKSVSFDTNQMRHFDHGYAVTSHSSQGLTAERVMVNLDSHIHADLINKRLAYVAVSRGSHDAHIYTDNAASLTSKLSHDVVKSSALQAVSGPEISM